MGATVLDIAYEDPNILVVNKSAGISVTDDREDGSENLTSLVLEYLIGKKEYAPGLDFAAAPCHRLDHFTGGLTVFAKTPEVLDEVLEAFKERRVKKFYHCIVKGTPERHSAELNHYLKKDAIAAKVKITGKPVKGAVPICTRYRTICGNGVITLLEVELVSGRTHQIRAHLAYIGHPLLGDDKYGNWTLNKKYKSHYQALWATRLQFYFNDASLLKYLNTRRITTNRWQFPEKAEQELAIVRGMIGQ
ncbi:MAG: RluA family pseudouridine synthase [Bacillota bacterium]|nr:RluA family pseudouridine synthase [Bacillota bacterium]